MFWICGAPFEPEVGEGGRGGSGWGWGRAQEETANGCEAPQRMTAHLAEYQ